MNYFRPNQLHKCFIRQGNYDDAVKSYQEIINKRPNDANLRFELGKLYLKLGRLEEALDEYSELLKIDAALAKKLAQEMNLKQ